jgi:hypothetical protein
MSKMSAPPTPRGLGHGRTDVRKCPTCPTCPDGEKGGKTLIPLHTVDISFSILRRFRPALPLLTISSSLVCSLLERSVKFTKRDLRT